MDKRDCQNLDRIRLQIGQLLRFYGAETEFSESQREDLTTNVYTVVHTRHGDSQSAFSSNRGELSALIDVAERRLGDLKSPFGKFELLSRTSEHGTVRCSDGIEIAIPIADLEVEEAGWVTARTSSLATPMDSQWLHWSPPGRFAEKPNARVYVNVRAADAMTVWCDLVRALEGASVPFFSKIGGSTEMMHRADGIVVYCGESDLHQILGCVADLGVADRLADGVPGFSVEVAKGIGVALHHERLDVPLVGSVGYHWSHAVVQEWADSGKHGLEAVYTRLAKSWAVTRRRIEAARTAELCRS